MSLCDRCKNKCTFMLKNKTLDACGLFEKQTNFDRITKTPEALANYFVQHHSCIGCQLKPNCEFNGIAHDCYKAMLKWLKQESE